MVNKMLVVFEKEWKTTASISSLHMCPFIRSAQRERERERETTPLNNGLLDNYACSNPEPLKKTKIVRSFSDRKKKIRKSPTHGPL